MLSLHATVQEPRIYECVDPLISIQLLHTYICNHTSWNCFLRYSWISSSKFVLLFITSWRSIARLANDLFSQTISSNLTINWWNAFNITDNLSWMGLSALGFIPRMTWEGKYSRIWSRLQSFCNQEKVLAADFCSVWMCWQRNVKNNTTKASICRIKRVLCQS